MVENPLGRERFARETGIKYSDLFGKFWARWNDAVHEPGLSPNDFKTTHTYSDDELIEKYIAVTRSLGHFPVKGEIRLIRRHDKSMPSDYTFDDRLWSKQAIIKRLVMYRNTHTGYGDIKQICQSAKNDRLIDLWNHSRHDDGNMGYVSY